MMVYGTCTQCGATPINDQTELCEACEDEARASGELGDETQSEDLPELWDPWEEEG
jgi:hypothetical protein